MISRVVLVKILLFSAVATLANASCPAQCVRIAGVDRARSFNFRSLESEQFKDFVPFLNDNAGQLGPSIIFHRVLRPSELLYSIAAAYDDKALDFFGRATVRFLPCCNNGDTELLEIHRRIALLYWGVHFVRSCFNDPALTARAMDIVREVGLDPMLIDSTTDVSYPWGFTRHLFDEHFSYFESDGWNEFGTESREFNLRPYDDTIGYKTQPQPGNPDRWVPLVISDGRGSLRTQVHLTPHIGYKARVYTMTEDDYASRRAPPPDYNFTEEVELLLQRSRILSRSPEKQALVLLYENKFISVMELLLQFAFKSAPPMFSQNMLFFSAYVMSFQVAAYDSVVLVWREKVRYDSVRPTTRLVVERGPDFGVAAIGGRGRETVVMRADEFDTYVPTQPHSEYPSGSACICQAMVDVMVAINGGKDELSGPELELVMRAGGISEDFPKEDLRFSYSNLSEIIRVCGVSRLDGGMHFTTSVPEAEKICTGIGKMAIEKAMKLVAGDASGRFAHFHDRAPIHRELPF